MPEGSKYTVQELDKMFQLTLDHTTWENWRENAAEDFEFKEGKQWTDEEASDLQDRGQSPVVINQIKVIVDRLIGQYQNTRTRITFRGRNPKDDDTANILTKYLIYIQQNTNYEFEELSMFDDGITGGFGCLEVFVEADELLEPSIQIRHEDCFNIYPDPYSKKYDWNEDARYIARAKWMDVEVAKMIWNDKAEEITQYLDMDPDTMDSAVDVRGELYVSENKKRVRPVEMWYKRKKMKVYAISPNGQRKDVTEGGRDELEEAGWRIDEKYVDRMHRMVYIGHVVLEGEEESPYFHNYFPFVPYYCYRKKSGEPYSPVRIMKDPQVEINKRRSKALHMILTNQAIYERGAVEDKEYLAEQKARPDGQIEYLPGRQFELNTNTEMGESQRRMYFDSKMEIREVTGINPDALGEKTEVRSGVGIARKQAMADYILAPIFNNIRRTKLITGKIVLDLCKQYYTAQKAFYILDEEGNRQQYTINDEDDDGNPINDIKAGVYDVIVEEAPDLGTFQQEQFDAIVKTMPTIAQFGPEWMHLLVQMSDIRNKDSILNTIEGMMKPTPVLPTVSLNIKYDELSGDEKSLMMTLMNVPGLAEQIAEANVGDLPRSQEKIMADLEKTKMKIQGEHDSKVLEAGIEQVQNIISQIQEKFYGGGESEGQEKKEGSSNPSQPDKKQ